MIIWVKRKLGTWGKSVPEVSQKQTNDFIEWTLCITHTVESVPNHFSKKRLTKFKLLILILALQYYFSGFFILADIHDIRSLIVLTVGIMGGKPLSHDSCLRVTLWHCENPSGYTSRAQTTGYLVKITLGYHHSLELINDGYTVVLKVLTRAFQL